MNKNNKIEKIYLNIIKYKRFIFYTLLNIKSSVLYFIKVNDRYQYQYLIFMILFLMFKSWIKIFFLILKALKDNFCDPKSKVIIFVDVTITWTVSQSTINVDFYHFLLVLSFHESTFSH